MKTATLRAPLVRSLLLVLALLVVPAASTAAVFVSVGIAPPVLPVYVQPPVPGPGYMWTPGYWAYGAEGYYWVPGTWVLAPYVGALWTPGYWGWGDGAYIWHGGYWGPHVGFYGGVNYGFGYVGVGYHGGYWNGGSFRYNTAVNNVNVTNIHNTYNQAVAQNTALTRVSYNGGTGGLTAQPTPEERLAERDVHQPATQMQLRHAQLASTNRAQLASVNHGTPTLMATPKAAVYRPQNVSATAAGHPQTTGLPQKKAVVSNQPQRTGLPQKKAVVSNQYQPHPQVHTQTAPHPQPEHHEEGHSR